MADKKAELRAKLTSVLQDVKTAKIDKRCHIEMVDGKIKADYSVSGLATTKNMESSYRDYSKIFDTWDEFKKYTEQFFSTDFKNYK